uniref:helix-turn-helix domain-containing protein n=1 Tax=Salinigranum rubrum TaxID=755307 RepID=UPI0013A57B9F|nr:helix-turn-helix domain-containing protein [Salinigranum rubrum]
MLESDPTARVIYKYVSDLSYCHSVTFLALSHFGTGLVFDAEQRGAVYRYRILAPNDTDMRGFGDLLDEELPDGVSVDVERIGDPDQWRRQESSVTELPFEQRQALETAFQMGYYETPRQSVLDEISTELDLPLSTLRYRLRRAEAWALERLFATSGLMDDGEMQPSIVANR